MKTKIALLIIVTLFSSCYTYRNIDIANQKPIIGEKYKIATAGATKWTGRMVKFTDSLITIQTPNKIEVPIPISRVLSIRKGKFSYGKTIGLSVATLGVGTLVYALISLGDWENDLSGMDLQF